jgi:hypothetical protein
MRQGVPGSNSISMSTRKATCWTPAFAVILLCVLCSCTAPALHEQGWQGSDSSRFGEGRPSPAGGRVERLGAKIISRWAYLDTPFSQIDLDLATGRVFERVPFAVGIICRLYQDEFPQAEEFSVEFHQGTYTYWFDAAYNRIERRVRTDVVRIIYSAYWMSREGLSLGVGIGGRFGELGIKDTDYHWVPPEQYKEGHGLFQVIGQAKAGFDTHLGFYVEGAITLGIDLGFFPCLFGAELSVGFYF